MENIGKRCYFSECKQLDFLPYDCRYCEQKFCQDHHKPDTHNCQQFAQTKNRNVSESKEKKNRCPIKGCKTILTLTNGYDCKECGKSMCMACRFPEKHGCIVKPRNQSKDNRKNSGADKIKQEIQEKEQKPKKRKGFFFCCGGDKPKRVPKKQK